MTLTRSVGTLLTGVPIQPAHATKTNLVYTPVERRPVRRDEKCSAVATGNRRDDGYRSSVGHRGVEAIKESDVVVAYKQVDEPV